MQRLTIIRTSGDADELLASKREHIDPVMKRKAGDYGLLAHVAARSDDGIVVVNLWDSEEGSQRAWDDPEIPACCGISSFGVSGLENRYGA